MPVTSCIEEHPSKKTVQIAGRYVSLRKLSAYTGIDHGYLSRMLRGKRDPSRMSVHVAMLLSAAMGMSVDELIEAIYKRADLLARDRAKAQVFLDYIESQQQQMEMAAARKGLPPPPRIPIPA
jgi:transcriptional regulator with XRE-family HTH domain